MSHDPIAGFVRPFLVLRCDFNRASIGKTPRPERERFRPRRPRAHDCTAGSDLRQETVIVRFMVIS